MSTGERGPVGDHGQPGGIGERGLPGERGPTGDHGQAGATGHQGERGQTGDMGLQGVAGERGSPYSSWLTRHVLAAYLILLVGVLAAFVFTEWRHDDTLRRIEAKAIQACEDDNERSRLTVEDLIDTRRRQADIDFGELLDVPPERGEELKRLALEGTDRRINATPFRDCHTGERLPGPVFPPPGPPG